MKVVAVTPVKMNNVRTPGKNTKLLGDGTPLIHCIQKSVLEVREIDEYYVYCSNPKIQDFLLGGVKYLRRSEEFDTPEADVLEMMARFSYEVDADIYIQIHATAPFIQPDTIRAGIEKMGEGYDSVAAVKGMQEFLWTGGKPLNYKLDHIPRTQDMKPVYRETTGMYIYTKHVIRDLHRRIGNRPYLLPVSEIEATDINDPVDFEIANAVYMNLLRPAWEGRG